jgi:hypothetical protein
MLRVIGIVVAMVITAALAPQPAWAWSVEAAPTNPDGSTQFADPDEQIEQMTGGSEDGGGRGSSSSFGSPQGGGWSMSVTPYSSFNRSPFGPMFNSGR